MMESIPSREKKPGRTVGYDAQSAHNEYTKLRTTVPRLW